MRLCQTATVAPTPPQATRIYPGAGGRAPCAPLGTDGRLVTVSVGTTRRIPVISAPRTRRCARLSASALAAAFVAALT